MLTMKSKSYPRDLITSPQDLPTLYNLFEIYFLVKSQIHGRHRKSKTLQYCKGARTVLTFNKIDIAEESDKTNDWVFI